MPRKDAEERRAYQKWYEREFRGKRPEVKQKQKERERKANRVAYKREYCRRPEVKARHAAGQRLRGRRVKDPRQLLLFPE